ncbi:amidohydrolase 2 [Zopfochytrium polystomum]|nr:amidohydrolase 2 [Zopfochytrium polystomum]
MEIIILSLASTAKETTNMLLASSQSFRSLTASSSAALLRSSPASASSSSSSLSAASSHRSGLFLSSSFAASAAFLPSSSCRALSTSTSSAAAQPVIVDVHTHVYLPRYMDMLRARRTVPRVFTTPTGQDRLLILPAEEEASSTAAGRPIGPEYHNQPAAKHAFMRQHGFRASVISLGNPWLDFIERDADAVDLAAHMNEDMERLCASANAAARKAANSDGDLLLLYGFGVLPTRSVDGCVAEVARIAKLPHVRGVILGTLGLGAGLDDPRLDPVWDALAAARLTVFLHPHYGVTPSLFGDRENGHVLPLALGFPFETTMAVSRLILAGTFDRHPDLKLLLAHSGGTLPFLAGRLDSCVAHDPHVAARLRHPPSRYLKSLLYDAVAYHPAALAATARLVGWDRLLFGTDHPFFPPLDADPEVGRWRSVDDNLAALEDAAEGDAAVVERVLAGNAVREVLGGDVEGL